MLLPRGTQLGSAAGRQSVSAAVGPSSLVLWQAEAHTLECLLMPVLLPQKCLWTVSIQHLQNVELKVSVF